MWNNSPGELTGNWLRTPMQPIACVHSCSVVFDSLHPLDCSPPGSSVLGIFQARILEWAAISYSRVSSWSRDQTCISSIFCIDRWILYHHAIWEAPYNLLNYDKEARIYSGERTISSTGGAGKAVQLYVN